MEIEIQVALVNAAATIIAAIIATAGVALVLAHRKTVLALAKEVEAYHRHEGFLVGRLIDAEGRKVTGGMVKQRRGEFRRMNDSSVRPSMTALQAKKIRTRYLSFD